MTFRQGFRESSINNLKCKHPSPRSTSNTILERRQILNSKHDQVDPIPAIMAPPSIQLLRALRATEGIRNSLPPRSHAHLPKHLSTRSTRMPCTRHLVSYSRAFSTSRSLRYPPPATPNKSTDRGPKSTEDTQTDFGSMDVFSNAPAPTASIDACLSDGFHLDNGVKIGDGSGLLLVSGEAFAWRPWEAGGRGRLLNQRGQWDTGDGAWGVLGLVWPKPGM